MNISSSACRWTETIIDRRSHDPAANPLIAVKQLFHCGPMLPGAPAEEWRLAGHAHGPPTLGLGICGHGSHIGGKIMTVVLEVAEQQIFRLAQVDAVVSDMAA